VQGLQLNYVLFAVVLGSALSTSTYPDVSQSTTDIVLFDQCL